MLIDTLQTIAVILLGLATIVQGRTMRRMGRDLYKKEPPC